VSQRTVKPLHRIGLSGQLGDDTVLGGGMSPRVHYIVIRIERGQFLAHGGNLLPQGCGALATAVAACKARTWQVVASMAIHIPCRFSFCLTKLQGSSRSAFSRFRITAGERAES
jgi:hypothetical protein